MKDSISLFLILIFLYFIVPNKSNTCDQYSGNSVTYYTVDTNACLTQISNCEIDSNCVWIYHYCINTCQSTYSLSTQKIQNNYCKMNCYYMNSVNNANVNELFTCAMSKNLLYYDYMRCFNDFSLCTNTTGCLENIDGCSALSTCNTNYPNFCQASETCLTCTGDQTALTVYNCFMNQSSSTSTTTSTSSGSSTTTTSFSNLMKLGMAALMMFGLLVGMI